MKTMGPLMTLFIAAGTAACGGPPLRPLDSALASAAIDQVAQGTVLVDERLVTFELRDGAPVAVVENFERSVPRTAEGRRKLQFHVAYNRPLVQVDEAWGAIYRKGLLVARLDRDRAEDLHDLEGFELYSSARSLVFSLDAVQAGDVLDAHSRQLYTDMRFLPVRQGFGQRWPVRSARLQVKAPAGWEIEWRAEESRRPVQWDPVKSGDGVWTTWTWERSDIPPVEDEVNAPAPVGHRLVTVRLKRWKDDAGPRDGLATAAEVSRYLHGFEASALRTTPAIDALARKLATAAGPDPWHQAAAIYDYVRREIAYCAVEVGYGGWKPHDAGAVLQVGYGDCKDKAALLSVLLKSAGIASRTAGIYSHDGVPRPFGLPTVAGSFNHAVLLVDLPGRSILCDPTSRVTPFGALPESDLAAPFLPADPTGAALMVAPETAPEQNRRELQIRLALAADGSAERTITASATGILAARLRHQLTGESAARQRKVLADQLRVSPAAVISAEVAQLDPDSSHAAAISWRAMVRVAAAVGIPQRLGLERYWVTTQLPVGESSRRSDYVLGPPRQTVERIEGQLPAGFRCTGAPDPVAEDSPAFSVRMTAECRPDGFIAERTVTVRQRVIGAADWAPARAQLQAAENTQLAWFVVEEVAP